MGILIYFMIVMWFFYPPNSPNENLEVFLPMEKVWCSSDDPNLTKRKGLLYFQEQPFWGFLIKRYFNGKVASIQRYEHGNLEGWVGKWYENGQMKAIRYYHLNKKDGVHKGWWKNGQQKFIYRFENGVYQGNCQDWYSNGQMFKDFNYVNGHEDGSQKMWEIDGRIRANYVIKSGRRYGLIGLKNCLSVTKNK